MHRQRLGRFQLLRLLQGFLGHFVLPSLICPAELRSTHMQSGRQTTPAKQPTATCSDCSVCRYRRSARGRPRLRSVLNYSSRVENFNAHRLALQFRSAAVPERPQSLWLQPLVFSEVAGGVPRTLPGALLTIKLGLTSCTRNCCELLAAWLLPASSLSSTASWLSWSFCSPHSFAQPGIAALICNKRPPVYVYFVRDTNPSFYWFSPLPTFTSCTDDVIR